MAFKYVGGPLANCVGRGKAYGASPTGPVVASTTLDSSYPIANLYNGIPALATRFAGTSAGCFFNFSNNAVPNGDMEQSALINVTSGEGWRASSATLAQTGTYYAKGTYGLSVAASGAGGGAYQDVTVQAGEYMQVWAQLRGNGTQSAQLTVRCLDTNKDLSSGGAWSSYGTFVATRATASFAATTVTFQVPDFTTLGKATTTLRVGLTVSAAGTVYFDEVFLVPGIDVVGVVGHGFDASTGVALATNGANYWHSPSSSISFGAASNTACSRQVAVVTNTSRVYDPFPGVFFYPGGAYGTYYSTVAPWVGELVVGQMRTFARDPQSLVIAPTYRGQQRSSTRGGTLWVQNATDNPVREVRIGLQTVNTTQLATAEQEFIVSAQGGRYPMLLLPQTLDASLGIYGRVSDTMSFSHVGWPLGATTSEVVLTEEPLPRM